MSIINMKITSKYDERPERLKYQTKRQLILTLNIRPKYYDITTASIVYFSSTFKLKVLYGCSGSVTLFPIFTYSFSGLVSMKFSSFSTETLEQIIISHSVNSKRKFQGLNMKTSKIYKETAIKIESTLLSKMSLQLKICSMYIPKSYPLTTFVILQLGINYVLLLLKIPVC